MLESFFTGLGKVVFTPFSWLLNLVGTVTQPVSGLLDSALVKIVLLIIVFFVLHRLTFDSKGNCHMFYTNVELKMQGFPWLAANLMAMYVTASGPYADLTYFNGMMSESDMKMTCFNFMEWKLFGKCVLALLLIIGVLTMLYYFGLGIRHGFRFLCGVIFAALMGSVYMEVRIWMLSADTVLAIHGLPGTLIRLLNSALTALECVVMIACCISLGNWSFPMFSVHESTRQRRAQETEEKKKTSE